MKYLSDDYVKVYSYKGYDICTLKVASPEKGDGLGYRIDDENFEGYEYSDLGQAVQDIDNRLMHKTADKADCYQRDTDTGFPDIDRFRKELKKNGYIGTNNICENYKRLVHEAGHNITLSELADTFNSPGEHSVYLNNIGEELKAQERMVQMSTEIEFGE